MLGLEEAEPRDIKAGIHSRTRQSAPDCARGWSCGKEYRKANSLEGLGLPLFTEDREMVWKGLLISLVYFIFELLYYFFYNGTSYTPVLISLLQGLGWLERGERTSLRALTRSA